jgi:lipopolysaccharide/colanic/teichoic acid biosynthesis glycosyltransferase
MSVAVERGKRVLDILLSGLGLLVSWPLWGIIALAIWIDDGRPIFYFQDRVSRGGGVFRVWKFRSMITDAERDGAKQARAGDDRITSVGRWLRATALDELPQLWNISAAT